MTGSFALGGDRRTRTLTKATGEREQEGDNRTQEVARTDGQTTKQAGLGNERFESAAAAAVAVAVVVQLNSTTTPTTDNVVASVMITDAIIVLQNWHCHQPASQERTRCFSNIIIIESNSSAAAAAAVEALTI